MILINLLPPELRKRAGGINPVAVSLAASAVVCLLLILMYVWVQVKIKNAKTLLEEKQAEVVQKTEEAAKVIAKEAQIAEFEAKRETLLALLGKKMYWAHTLDDFSNLLAGNWPGFVVRCMELTLAPKGGERKGETSYSFRIRLQLVGEDRVKSGDYVDGMFRTIKGSTFWNQDGFVGKPEATYFGDAPSWNSVLSKVIISFNLEFERVKSFTKPKAGG
jgi:hypothetical protein